MTTTDTPRTMTPAQINRRISEMCGWYEMDNETTVCWTNHAITYCIREDELPDYCNDLNAMHEAERTLFEEGRIADYSAQLYWLSVPKIAQHDDHFHDHIVTGYIATATASKRAEAFLRTIGKWEDNK